MNGVYALLEEDLGCRFYTNDSIFLPKTNTLIVSPVAADDTYATSHPRSVLCCAFDPTGHCAIARAPRAGVPEEFGRPH